MTRSKDEHQDALVNVIAEAMNVYLRAHNGVHVDVVQSALGSVLTETFDKIVDHGQRLHLLDSFCVILRETVEDEIERERSENGESSAVEADTETADSHDDLSKARTLN